VWHEGLLHKIKTVFSGSIHKVLKPYLENRYFLIKYRGIYISSPGSIVLQGSVLGLLLYLLYTADLSTAADSRSATFADETAFLTTHYDPAIATYRLQTNINKIQIWLKK
jgi:hypothetical protein